MNCPVCGEPMAQARQGEDVYLCGNLYCGADDLKPPMKMLVSRERLREQIASDPDADCTAGRAALDLEGARRQHAPSTPTTANCEHGVSVELHCFECSGDPR